jgi:heme exporter protein D
MQFESWADFWAMGGYGLYVWSSFIISFLALALLLVDSRMTKRKLFTEVLREVARKARIQRSRQSENDVQEKAKHES